MIPFTGPRTQSGEDRTKASGMMVATEVLANLEAYFCGYVKSQELISGRNRLASKTYRHGRAYDGAPEFSPENTKDN